MDSSSSDEDDCEMVFWNNWFPSTTQTSDKVKLNMMGVENSKFGNWIPPPRFFLNTSSKYEESKSSKSVTKMSTVRKRVPKPNQEHSQREKEGPTNSQNCATIEGFKEVSEITWRKEINLDWGKRRQLHDVTMFNDGDLIWGILHLGTFANIKLWLNEYGNICCLAWGRISRMGCSEVTYVAIKNGDLLRKMLHVSPAQWSSICESVKETKTNLEFDAYKNYNLREKTSLERLWYFICKRRHLLPRQCMLLKLCGAIKCMRRFDIIPKLLVQDIRYIQEEPVSEME